MVSYDLKVGYSCNNKCIHCVIYDSKDDLLNKYMPIDLTAEECLNKIDEAVLMNATDIVLTGGEVTLRKDFAALVERCQNNNLSITIQTNGRLLSSEKILSAVSSISNVRFIVALHSDDENIHDYITNICGSFNETCKGINAITSIGKYVILKVVVSKLNMTGLGRIVRLASSLGVKYICFAFPHAQGAARKNFDKVVPMYYELQPYLIEAIQEAENNHLPIVFEAVPFCIIPNYPKLVGEIRYMKSKTFCSPVNEALFDWNETRLSIKSKGEDCVRCVFDKYCEGVWSEYTTHFGFGEFIPVLAADRLPIRSKSASSSAVRV